MATATVVAVGASLPAVAAENDAPASPSATSTPPKAGPTPSSSVTASTVTLVTGDRVTVTNLPGAAPAVRVDPAPGAATTAFQTSTTANGDLYVIPSSAAESLAAQSLDRELFNISRLIRDGYADGAADQIPVIVGYADTPSRTALTSRTDDLPASDRGVVLDRLDMAALHVDKAKARSFWNAAKPAAARPGQSRAAVARAAGDRVVNLWYDAPAQATLDESVPQIGAPTAWEAGYDGKGVTVAILDTGADLNHPDIKDRIAGSTNFVTPGKSAQDGHGHGTHVASTIAGSGAASGGKYKGVAPAADLLIGKVLGDDGRGPTSGVLAGMEWAVAQDADVVNMSLGSPTTAATTPQSEALNRLSATSHTLFVVAAGNDGPGDYTVGSPGIADAALTVGAVDKQEELAYFSSRGPLADGTLKPDITAPGVNIVAARAAGTSMGTPVDDSYTSANGTSMATPHVAGAAAILAQRHPGWDDQQLKATLASHARPSDAYTVHEQGNGRVDIAASLDARIDIVGNVDFGTVPEEEGEQPPVTRTVTVSNPTDTATTVTLSLAMRDGLPAGAVTLPQEQVDVPAGGTAAVSVVLDPNGIAKGPYSGQLTATTSDGATAHTAVGMVKEPPFHDLSFQVRDRAGNPGVGVGSIKGLDNDFVIETTYFADSQRLRVPAGRYAVVGYIWSQDATGMAVAQDLFNVADIEVGDDTQVTIDARKSEEPALRVTDEKRPLEATEFANRTVAVAEDGTYVSQGFSGHKNRTTISFGAIPSTGAPTVGETWTSFQERVSEPLASMQVPGPGGFTPQVDISDGFARFEGTRRLPLVDVGGGTAAELEGRDLKGRAVLLHVESFRDQYALIQGVLEAGAAAVVVAPGTDREQDLNSSAPRATAPVLGVDYAEGSRLGKLAADNAERGRATMLVLKGKKEIGYTYSGQWEHHNGIPEDLTETTRTRDYATLDNTFHGNQAESSTAYTQYVFGQSPVPPLAESQELRLGNKRKDHVYARNAMSFIQEVDFGGDAMMTLVSHLGTYRPGQVERHRWLAPALRASFTSDYPCNFCRTDAVTTVFNLAFGGDSDPKHIFVGYPALGIEFGRNGELLSPADPWFVDEKATYQLYVDTDYSAVLPGRRASTEFSFTSTAPTGPTEQNCQDVVPTATVCEAVPLITPIYDMPVDILNRASANRPFSFTLNAPHVTGWDSSTTPIRSARAWVSYDDGETWTSTTTRRVDTDSFTVSYRHPKLAGTSGFVSVRTEVEDSAGNTTKQTMVRAYALK